MFDSGCACNQRRQPSASANANAVDSALVCVSVDSLVTGSPYALGQPPEHAGPAAAGLGAPLLYSINGAAPARAPDLAGTPPAGCQPRIFDNSAPDCSAALRRPFGHTCPIQGATSFQEYKMDRSMIKQAFAGHREAGGMTVGSGSAPKMSSLPPTRAARPARSRGAFFQGGSRSRPGRWSRDSTGIDWPRRPAPRRARPRSFSGSPASGRSWACRPSSSARSARGSSLPARS